MKKMFCAALLTVLATTALSVFAAAASPAAEATGVQRYSYSYSCGGRGCWNDDRRDAYCDREYDRRSGRDDASSDVYCYGYEDGYCTYGRRGCWNDDRRDAYCDREYDRRSGRDDASNGVYCDEDGYCTYGRR